MSSSPDREVMLVGPRTLELLSFLTFEIGGVNRKILKMPEILRIGPYEFFIVSLDFNEPPHIHVRRANNVAKFWLDPVSLQRSGGFSRSELNKIAELVEENRQYLMERWYDFFGTDVPDMKLAKY